MLAPPNPPSTPTPTDVSAALLWRMIERGPVDITRSTGMSPLYDSALTGGIQKARCGGVFLWLPTSNVRHLSGAVTQQFSLAAVCRIHRVVCGRMSVRHSRCRGSQPWSAADDDTIGNIAAGVEFLGFNRHRLSEIQEQG